MHQDPTVLGAEQTQNKTAPAQKSLQPQCHGAARTSYPSATKLSQAQPPTLLLIGQDDSTLPRGLCKCVIKPHVYVNLTL